MNDISGRCPDSLPQKSIDSRLSGERESLLEFDFHVKTCKLSSPMALQIFVAMLFVFNAVNIGGLLSLVLI